MSQAVLTLIVMLGQACYTAGDALSGGLFLAYYLESLSGSLLSISLLLVLPETVAVAGLLGQSLVRQLGSPKRVWLLFAVVARLAGLAIAALGTRPDAAAVPLLTTLLLALLIVAEIAQAISYAGLVAWLVALVDRDSWGTLFARRQVAISGMLMLAPIVSGRAVLARFGTDPTPAEYATVLAIGQAITTAGVLILALLPAAASTGPPATPLRPLLRRLWQRKPTRRTLLTACHLAAAQGLTQLAFYAYGVRALGLDAGTRQQLTGLMFAMQIPCALVAGHLLDRMSNRAVYLWSLVGVAWAVPFWWLGLLDWRWVIGAYVVWGLFGAVNVAGRNAMLKLVDPSDAAGASAAFRFVAGLVAGVSGLIGGLVIDSVDDARTTAACVALMAISFAGRLTAPLWLRGWREADG